MELIKSKNVNSSQSEYVSAFVMNEQLDPQSLKMIKFINNIPRLHPRKFCRYWFGLESFREDGRPRYREELILAMEAERGYREQCINLLAKILRLKPNTIQRWGKGVQFDQIPLNKQTQYEIYLGYVYAIRTLFIQGNNYHL